MVTNQEVWCLAVNYKNKPIGLSFKLVLGGDITDLKEKVKEKKSITLPTEDLSVWRCKDRNVIFDDDEDPTTLEGQVREAFANVQRLGPRRKIQDLGVLTGETLLVKFPVVTVWYLVIDHENKPIGMPTELVLGRNIVELREKVKEKDPDDLSGVSAHRLTVWQCKERKLFADKHNEELEKLINTIDFFDMANELTSATTVTSLDLDENEILLVRMPSARKREAEVEDRVIVMAVWYLLINHENKPIGTPDELVLGGGIEYIADFREKVKEKNSIALPADELTVWQCKERKLFADKRNEELEELINTIDFSDMANELTSATTVTSLDLDENEILLVRMPAPSASARKRGAEVEDRVAKRQRFSEAQSLDVEAACNALPPSSAAVMPAFRNEQEKRPILNGRPHHNSGPPVGLFHPVFNSFQTTMRNPERIYADAETYSSVRALFQAFAYIYEDEGERVEAIDEHLGTLLGGHFGTWQAPGVTNDRVITQPCGPSTAYVAIREIKNEIGTARADPYNQGSLAYRKYWAAEPQDIIRRYSHCPSIILAIAGPWLCVCGGVYLQQAVIQPLTDYIWLGGDDFNEDRLLFATRLFAALKSAISTLRLYYDDLALRLSSRNSQNPISDAFPFVTEYRSTKFTYLSRLAPEYPHKLLYKAKLNNERRMIVVKFVSRYHAEAHRILAKHHLAPTLHYAGTDDAEASMYGGRYMIVMDFVEGKLVGSLSEHQFNQVDQAIKILHSNDIVFGDLRQPNILITDKGAMIIDFDWCGQAGESRYPASLNPDGELGWHEHVKPDSVMMKDHDMFMLKKLPLITIAG